MSEIIDKASDIFQSWVTSFNPSEEEKSLAEYRAGVCNTCSMRKTHSILKYPICGARTCVCPLSKLIFSKKEGTCPMNLWMS
jgi:hypothetical protein